MARPVAEAAAVGVSIGFMADSEDTNAAVWKSDIGVNFWKSTQDDRERRRAGHRTLMAELLPFGADQPFTFVDLGAGTGAASRVILDHFTAARAILADFSAQMMAQGEVELKPYEGRYHYVEFDLAAAVGSRRSPASSHASSTTASGGATGS